ncbi:MAG: class I cytochrome c [Terriglobia bacterium]|nr:MAG: class I cytochrome c [Terriglobia bacterium]
MLKKAVGPLPAIVVVLAAAVPLAAQAPDGRGRAEPARSTRGGAGAGNQYTVYDDATLQRGKALFTAQCGFCHGANAKGGEGGPDLLRAVPVLDDENGNLIGPIVLNGRPERGMPKFSLTREQISDITAFLHEGIRAAAQRATYPLRDIVTGNAAAGRAYFNGTGKCSTCHSVTGDLRGIGGKYDPVTLQGKFLMPRGGGRGPFNPAETGGNPVTVTVTLPGGKVFEGKLQRIDDFDVALTDAAGEYHSFPRKGDVPAVVVHDPLQAHFDLLRKYSDADMHNLTAYLVTLK